jgi:hypothetical protein
MWHLFVRQKLKPRSCSTCGVILVYDTRPEDRRTAHSHSLRHFHRNNQPGETVGRPGVCFCLPCARANGGGLLQVMDFIRSVELLAWAKENGCPWVARTCALIAQQGHLPVPRRARELDCPWDASTCAALLTAGTWRCWRGRSSTGAPR